MPDRWLSDVLEICDDESKCRELCLAGPEDEAKVVDKVDSTVSCATESEENGKGHRKDGDFTMFAVTDAVGGR